MDKELRKLGNPFSPKKKGEEEKRKCPTNLLPKLMINILTIECMKLHETPKSWMDLMTPNFVQALET